MAIEIMRLPHASLILAFVTLSVAMSAPSFDVSNRGAVKSYSIYRKFEKSNSHNAETATTAGASTYRRTTEKARKALFDHFLTKSAYNFHAASPRHVWRSELSALVRQAGETLDRCSSSGDCVPPRTCETFEGSLRCLPPNGLQPCTKGSECPGAEICLTLSDETTSVSRCTSENFANEVGATPVPGDPPATDNEPCIGVRSLTHLSREELVFEKDRLANVLCDKDDSCATPGHMVVYHGKGMMMRSYCEIIGECVRKVMHVNSPRYSVKNTVPSNSKDMVFTAFAARYVTRAEEGMLAFAIRLGL